MGIISLFKVMAGDLAEIMQNFDLLSVELQATSLGTEEIVGGLSECKVSLIGKVMGEKVSNYTGVKNFVTVAWSYPRELRVVELGPNMFQFIIPAERDGEDFEWRTLDNGQPNSGAE